MSSNATYNLPDAVLVKIFSFLSLADIQTIQNVSVHWKYLCGDPSIWKNKKLFVDYMSDDGAIKRLLRILPQIRIIEFHRSADPGVFREISANCRHISTLTIDHSQDLHFTCFKTMCESCTMISNLTIPSTLLHSQEYYEIIGGMKNLKQLCIKANSHLPVHLKSIADGCSKLETFHLWHTTFERDALFYFLTKKNTLLSLRFSLANGSPGNIRESDMLDPCAKVLKELYILDCYHATPNTFLGLKKLTNLTVLSFSDLTGISCEIVAEAFSSGSLNNLKSLEFNQSNETAVSDVVIRSVCNNCPLLEELVIELEFYDKIENMFTDRGTELLSQLQHLKKLVLLKCNSLTLVTAAHISKCKNLQVLDIKASNGLLASNSLTLWCSLNRLHTLVIDLCNLADLSLGKWIQNMPNLKVLSIKYCLIPDEELSYLQTSSNELKVTI